MVRWIVLKKASWLKKRFSVFGFRGGRCVNIDSRSIDRITPVKVMISALSFIVVGMVMVVVVCNVDSLVIVPMKIDPRVNRRMGLVGDFVSWWGLCLLRGKSVSVK